MAAAPPDAGVVGALADEEGRDDLVDVVEGGDLLVEGRVVVDVAYLEEHVVAEGAPVGRDGVEERKDAADAALQGRLKASACTTRASATSTSSSHTTSVPAERPRARRARVSGPVPPQVRASRRATPPTRELARQARDRSLPRATSESLEQRNQA